MRLSGAPWLAMRPVSKIQHFVTRINISSKKNGRIHYREDFLTMRKLVALFAALLTASIAFAAVNINTATKTELEALPGVGPVRAQAIIDYRAKNGNFKALEDIKKVDGIGDGIFADSKDKISLSGPTKIDWEAKKEAPKADAAKKDAPKADAGKAAAPVAATAAKDAPKKDEPKKEAAPAKKEMTKEEKAAEAKAKKEADKKKAAEEKAKKAEEKKKKAEEAKAKKEADAKAKKEPAAKKDAPKKEESAKKDAPAKDATKKEEPKK
jgi:competence protein ComEA